MTETPPYTITSTILDLSERIGEAVGRAEEAAVGANLRPRRANRIRTIRGSLAIEGNRLTEEQVSTILEGKPVVAPLREIQEVRNAINAYEQYLRWSPRQRIRSAWCPRDHDGRIARRARPLPAWRRSRDRCGGSTPHRPSRRPGTPAYVESAVIVEHLERASVDSQLDLPLRVRGRCLQMCQWKA